MYDYLEVFETKDAKEALDAAEEELRKKHAELSRMPVGSITRAICLQANDEGGGEGDRRIIKFDPPEPKCTGEKGHNWNYVDEQMEDLELLHDPYDSAMKPTKWRRYKCLN